MKSKMTKSSSAPMETADRNNFLEYMRLLRLTYVQELPKKTALMEELCDGLMKNWEQEKLELFYRIAHSLAGSGGTYGFPDVSISARELQTFLKPLLKNPSVSQEEKARTLEYLKRLNQVCIDLQRSFQYES